DSSDWKLEAVSSADVMNDRELSPVGRPVRKRDILEQLSRCPAFERYAGEGSGRPPDGLVADQDRELAVLRHRKDPSVRDLELPGLVASSARREDLRRLALPGGAVHDRLAIGGESRAVNRAAAECEARVGDRRLLAVSEETPSRKDA